MKINRGKKERPVKMLIYGPEGLGKSTMASHAPNPIWLDLEESSNHLDVPSVEINSWSDLISALVEMTKSNQGCDTLVIDTMDKALSYCIDAVVSEGGKPSIEDFGFGKGYVLLAEKFKELLPLLDKIRSEQGMNIILVCHSHIVKFELPEQEGQFDKYEMRLLRTNKADNAALLKDWVDAVIFINWQTDVTVDENNKRKHRATGFDTRIVYTTRAAAYDAKNRYGLKHSYVIKGMSDYSKFLKNLNFKSGVVKEKVIEKELSQKEDTTSFNSPLYDFSKKEGISLEDIHAICVLVGKVNKDVVIDNFDDTLVKYIIENPINLKAAIKDMESK